MRVVTNMLITRLLDNCICFRSHNMVYTFAGDIIVFSTYIIDKHEHNLVGDNKGYSSYNVVNVLIPVNYGKHMI